MHIKTVSFIRALLLGAAVAGAGFAALPAQAQPSARFYKVTLATPAKHAQFVARELLWTCAGDQCSASKGASRPAIICAAVAKAVGPLLAFTADAQAFDAAQLAACNERAS